MKFKLASDYQPAGDQPKAIEELVKGIRSGLKSQVLLGVTGSGKTFTMANVIARLNKPTLVVSHNKTLAAQLYQEYRDFFPENAVSYFVSYYDYYQPEAYVPQTDTYIEKETDVNDLIDKLRLQATTNLLTRKDVIVVASVSCIYNLGSPSAYTDYILKLEMGQEIVLRETTSKLIDLQYVRSQNELLRGQFRIRGGGIDIWPAYEDRVIRVTVNDEKIASLVWVDSISFEVLDCAISENQVLIYPAKHYLTRKEDYQQAMTQIKKDLQSRVTQLKAAGKEIPAHRLWQKVNYDLEMIAEVGYVNGIENYSRYFDGRMPGERPHTLMDYFKECNEGYLTIVDESHISLPQIRGMYIGDRSRKQTLIDHGFRLPAALDNRPLTGDEFLKLAGNIIFTSATPGEWEMEKASKESLVINHGKNESRGIVEQLIRPTGLIDPIVEIRKAENQVVDLVIEIIVRKNKGQRVLVTTLTKKSAEDLSEFLNNEEKISRIINVFNKQNLAGDRLVLKDTLKITYLHADIKTLDRQDKLDELRKGEIDVLVGINLLREGLDLPEVSLVAVLDADSEGFLRSDTSLIQTMGRAARHLEGKVILYADVLTSSMRRAIEEVERRKKIQVEYNLRYNITPQNISKPIREKLVIRENIPEDTPELPRYLAKKYRLTTLAEVDADSLLPEDRRKLIAFLKRRMLAAAGELDFEAAANIRDITNRLTP